MQKARRKGIKKGAQIQLHPFELSDRNGLLLHQNLFAIDDVDTLLESGETLACEVVDNDLGTLRFNHIQLAGQQFAVLAVEAERPVVSSNPVGVGVRSTDTNLHIRTCLLLEDLVEVLGSTVAGKEIHSIEGAILLLTEELHTRDLG